MTSLSRPKRALLAYCALADRLHQSNASIVQALTPFFTPVCRDLAGKLFDAAQFSQEVMARYDLKIPRLAVLGLAEQLERDGLLISVAGHASKPVYQYAAAPSVESNEVPAVTEGEIDSVLAEFVSMCRGDPVLSEVEPQDLQQGFLERLLNTDSMRLLSRREGSSAAKKSSTTLTIRAPALDGQEHRELRLDFQVAQFLVDLQVARPELFSRVSDIAFANMAAEALACFSDPAGDVGSLKDFVVYLDSPLLLDILGVNADYAEYGAELLQMISDAGATAAVFDDCIVEAESVVAAQHAALRSGIAQRTGHWGMSAKPHVLMALIGNVGERAASKGIAVHKDPELDLIRKAKATVGDIQAELTKRMAGWPTQEARQHDERSVWAMLRIRDSSTLCTRIRDSKAVFVARNTGLVRIANDAWRIWLQNGARHSQSTAERWAPISMSDKQLAGYLWMRRGAGDGKMSRARLLAHCSAAIRPRPDVKARAYNLVLELHGKDEADHIAALLEDREGERALMRATRADPEDVTKERLPYIIEQVKLAAGEFAAAAVREQGQIALDAAKKEADERIGLVQAQAAEELERIALQAKGVSDALTQERLDRGLLEGKVATLAGQLRDAERLRRQNEVLSIGRAFSDGQAAYTRMRWELVLLFASISLFVSANATDWDPGIQLSISFVVAAFGFWFVPEYLEGLVRWHGMRQLGAKAELLGVSALLPAEGPDFKSRTWAALDELRKKAQSS